MFSQANATQKILAFRPSTATPGFSVRQSEETIKSLRKENFNLKLKMYLMHSKTSSPSQTTELNTPNDKQYIDMFTENELLKMELNDLQNLLKISLDAIRKLEEQKAKFQKQYEDLLLERQMQKEKISKVCLN